MVIRGIRALKEDIRSSVGHRIVWLGIKLTLKCPMDDLRSSPLDIRSSVGHSPFYFYLIFHFIVFMQLYRHKRLILTRYQDDEYKTFFFFLFLLMKLFQNTGNTRVL